MILLWKDLFIFTPYEQLRKRKEQAIPKVYTLFFIKKLSEGNKYLRGNFCQICEITFLRNRFLIICDV